MQDIAHFKRMQWEYMVLDEAHLIKNFKSQKWNLLLPLVTTARLLLTGTPLQNDIMELWSFLHFLMPHIFVSHSDFKEWFSNPLLRMVEDTVAKEEGTVNYGVLRHELFFKSMNRSQVTNT